VSGSKNVPTGRQERSAAVTRILPWSGKLYLRDAIEDSRRQLDGGDDGSNNQETAAFQRFELRAPLRNDHRREEQYCETDKGRRALGDTTCLYHPGIF
jgi:hypothetical protein